MEITWQCVVPVEEGHESALDDAVRALVSTHRHVSGIPFNYRDFVVSSFLHELKSLLP
jgi:hypothetical protein